MAFYLSPIGNGQFLDVNGNPLNGGKIYTYVANSTTPVATYTDFTGATPQANPIILNSLGLPASPIWLDAAAVKLIVKDSTDVQQGQPYDNVTGIGALSANQIFDEWVAFVDAATYLSPASFSVVGDQTDLLQVGRRLKSQNTGGLAYSTITSSVCIDLITTVTLTHTSGALDAGLSSIYYGFLAATTSSLPNSLVARNSLGIPAGIGKNKLINPNFAVNQRAVSGTVVLAAGIYGHDRFKAGAGGCTYTFATALNVTTLTITAGTLMQVIDGVNLTSGTHTASHVGTSQVRINGGAYGASGTTATAIGGTNQTIEWNAGTLSSVQYEQGGFATAFEHKLRETTFLECCRYFQFIASSTYLAAVAFSTNRVLSGIALITPMRALPSASCLGTAFTWFFNGAAVVSSGVTITITAHGVGLDVLVTATAGTAGVGLITNLTINAEL